jgi:hypothetical protein
MKHRYGKTNAKRRIRTSPRLDTPRDRTGARPEVIVDVLFDDGLLFIAVQNIGDRPALDVSVAFDKPIHGVNGTIEISSLSLFRNIAFLAPRKSIQTFLDTSAWRHQSTLLNTETAMKGSQEHEKFRAEHTMVR